MNNAFLCSYKMLGISIYTKMKKLNIKKIAFKKKKHITFKNFYVDCTTSRYQLVLILHQILHFFVILLCCKLMHAEKDWFISWDIC